MNRTETEEISERCYRWAPERFGWKRYPYPDIRVVGEALRDAKKRKNGNLMAGDEKVGGWLLTPSGISWIAQHGSLIDRLSSSPGRSALPIVKDRLLQSITGHSVFEAWMSGSPVSRSDVADALDMTADAQPEVLRMRLDTLINAALVSEDPQLKEFTTWLRDRLQQLA